MKESSIIDDLRSFTEIFSSVDTGRADYYKSMLDAAKAVEVVSMREVLTDDEIDTVMSHIRPEAKKCYKNAVLMCNAIAGCEYVEGRIGVCGIPIDHAFNKVRGKYIDVTEEVALKGKVGECEYASILECNYNTVASIVIETGLYGSIYSYIYDKEHPSKKD